MRAVLIAFVLLALFPVAGDAQTPATPTTPALQAPATTSVGDHYDAMLRTAQWDEIVSEATAALARLPTSPDDTYLLHYYRGRANWQLGLLDEAATEIASVADQAPPQNIYPPKTILDTIERQKAARPPHLRDVTIGGTLCFTVYYDADDLALHQLLDLLPVAVTSVRGFTNEPPRRTVILLFESLDKMQAYSDIPRRGPPIDKAVLAIGGPSGVRICLEHQGIGYEVDPRGGYFRMTITHEYMHVIVSRILEAHANLPAWFNEGIATVAGGRSAPAELGEFARRFRRTVDHKAILSLEDMRGRAFYETAISHFSDADYEDPYAQAASMVTYLLLGRPDSIFADLLQAMRRTNDFGKAFKDTFGESVDEFYTDWHAYTVH